MGEFANLHASEMYNQELDTHYEYSDKAIIPLNFIPYSDIKRRTDKSILIKLLIQVSPFNIEKYDVDYMWLSLKWINLDEISKSVAITPWLLERKIDEQCSLIANRITK